MDDKTIPREPAGPDAKPKNWDLRDDPIFAKGWLDDLEEAIEAYERAVDEAEEIIRLY